MDGVQPHLTVRTSFVLLLLSLLQMSRGEMCSAPTSLNFPENNTLDAVVTTITVNPGVTLEFTPPSNNAFRLRGNQLLAAKVFDFESGTTEIARVTCTETASSATFKLTIVVILQNVNDNAPVFGQSLYPVDVSEMSPVGTTVGNFAATDADKHSRLLYTLTPESSSFELKSPSTPDLIVRSPLDYDAVKNVKLVLLAQDTPLSPSDKNFTATTTIMVTITDADNRPPWFQPCTKHEIGAVLVCQSPGYTGTVFLNELQNGALLLEPGPLYAIDGDSGINEAMTYSFLSGNDEGLFQINANSGNISMLKAATALDTINLRVLAAQRINSHQFATTSLTIRVLVKSLHPPQFQKPRYEGVITSVGSMATDGDGTLYIHATDADYNEVPNPNIVYTIEGSSDFFLIQGHLFLNKDLPPATFNLQVVATDSANEESDTVPLIVQVKTGLTTTSIPLSTTNIMTTPLRESTTNIQTTPLKETTTNIMTTPLRETATSISTTVPRTGGSTISTTAPIKSTATGNSVSTPKVTMSTEGSVSTAGTAPPPTVIVASGGYGPGDMAALGATLGVLLLVCLVVIGVLVHRLRKGKADWKKIFEVSLFRSSLGQSSGAEKKGVQYTNETFQNDEDGGSTGSGGPEGGVSMEAIVKASLPLHALLPEDINEAGSDTADSEKEVKPILTKERRTEEGYKAVWFKEDIDPNAKEEVVIIPDTREEDSEEEDDPDEKTRKVNFDDTDLDSGLGVKMGDQPEDSDSDGGMTSDL